MFKIHSMIHLIVTLSAAITLATPASAAPKLKSTARASAASTVSGLAKLPRVAARTARPATVPGPKVASRRSTPLPDAVTRSIAKPQRVLNHRRNPGFQGNGILTSPPSRKANPGLTRRSAPLEDVQSKEGRVVDVNQRPRGKRDLSIANPISPVQVDLTNVGSNVGPAQPTRSVDINGSPEVVMPFHPGTRPTDADRFDLGVGGPPGVTHPSQNVPVGPQIRPTGPMPGKMGDRAMIGKAQSSQLDQEINDTFDSIATAAGAFGAASAASGPAAALVGAAGGTIAAGTLLGKAIYNIEWPMPPQAPPKGDSTDAGPDDGGQSGADENDGGSDNTDEGTAVDEGESDASGDEAGGSGDNEQTSAYDENGCNTAEQSCAGGEGATGTPLPDGTRSDHAYGTDPLARAALDAQLEVYEAGRKSSSSTGAGVIDPGEPVVTGDVSEVTPPGGDCGIARSVAGTCVTRTSAGRSAVIGAINANGKALIGTVVGNGDVDFSDETGGGGGGGFDGPGMGGVH